MPRSSEALVDMCTTAVESDGAGREHLSLVEKSLFAPSTHKVKDVKEVPPTR